MKKLKWFYWLAILCLILPACSLTDQIQTLSPTATPVPPTVEPSPVPPTPTPVIIVVTSTSAPTDTPLPAAPTTRPTTRPANPPAPTNTPVASMATVILYNGLGKQITVDLSGPEQKHFSLPPKATKEFEVKPGTYNYSITATGFYPLRGAVTFVPGINPWNLGKAKP